MLDYNVLKGEVPIEVWENITQGEDSLGNKFIHKARTWMASRLRNCNIFAWDEDEEIIKQILICRALYEMYAYVEKEALAFDKREAAEEMLRGRFGRCVDGIKDDNRTKAVPVVSIKQGRNSWKNF